MQEKIAVRPDDTPESLQQKITENIEHRLLVSAIKKILIGNRA